jgi:hypothetical protein
MLPVVPVIVVVLAFNFLGDGLRDAAAVRVARLAWRSNRPSGALSISPSGGGVSGSAGCC